MEDDYFAPLKMIENGGGEDPTNATIYFRNPSSYILPTLVPQCNVKYLFFCGIFKTVVFKNSTFQVLPI